VEKHGNPRAQMPYLQEDAPRKEIDLSPQVGDLNLGEDLNLSWKICKGMLEMWKRRALQETM
jgi:hypothetical protein